jgi:alanine dehydrogenase
MSINICLDLPQMSVTEFARRQGVTPDSVKQLMNSGALPFIQRGRGCVRYVNMVALAAQAAQLFENQSAWNQPHEIEGLS